MLNLYSQYWHNIGIYKWYVRLKRKIQINKMMITSPDLIFGSLILFTYLLLRSRQTLITLSAFFALWAFSQSFLFDGLSAFYIHITYTIITVPFILISNLRNACALAIYAIFNCFIAYDYLIYPNSVTFITNYYNLLHNIIDLCLIYLSIERGEDVDRNNSSHFRDILGCRLGFACIQKYSKKMETI